MYGIGTCRDGGRVQERGRGVVQVEELWFRYKKV